MTRTSRFASAFLAGLATWVCIAAPAPAADPNKPAGSKYTDQPIAVWLDPKAPSPQLLTPRYVYRPRAVFQYKVAAGKAPAGVLVKIHGQDADVAVRLEQIPQAQASSSRTVTFRSEVDAADWPDGAYTATFHEIRKDKDDRQVGRETFRVVRDLLADKVKPEIRNELKVWIDHANQGKVAWGKRPFWRALDEAMTSPGSPYQDLRGLTLRSYRSEQLSRLMPYAMYVPEAYDPNKPMPLMILLHGSGGDYLNVISDVYEGQELESHPMLLANAGAFPHWEYRHLALIDVLAVLKDVKSKYNVDVDRVYLQGISLGGRGSLEVPALTPGVFAAACPQGVYGFFQDSSDPVSFARMSEYSRWQLSRQDMRTYLPNLTHTPMQIVMGYKDRTTPALNALTFAHLLKMRYGATVDVRGFDADHNITYPTYKWSDTRKWLLQHKRIADPDTVHARTATLRFNRFYWVIINQMEDHWKVGEVQAVRDVDTRVVSVKTANVTSLSLLGAPKPKTIRIDGQVLDARPDSRSLPIVTVRRDPGGSWQVVEGEKERPARGEKRHGVSGPMWDISSGRCVVVVGSGGGRQETQKLKGLGKSVGYHGAAWGDNRWPVVRDVDVTDEMRKECNLILVGDARTNRLIAGQDWPFDMKAIGRHEGIALPSDPNTVVKGAGDVLQFVYPSPFAEGRYAMVVAPLGRGGAPIDCICPANTWDPRSWADWSVLRYRKITRGKQTRVGAVTMDDGVFDSRWKMVVQKGTVPRSRYMNWEK